MEAKKVLVVDFDQDFLKSMSKLLSRQGFQVVCAADGQAGLEKFKAEMPDLVVMEAMLPKIHGFELCNRIATHPSHKTPVIITTAVYKDALYKTESLKTFGASAYFEKPVDEARLLTSIRKVLGLPPEKPAPIPGGSSPDPFAAGDRGTPPTEEKGKASKKKELDREDIDLFLKKTLSEFGLQPEKKKPVAPTPVPPPIPSRAKPPVELAPAAPKATPTPSAPKLREILEVMERPAAVLEKKVETLREAERIEEIRPAKPRPVTPVPQQPRVQVPPEKKAEIHREPVKAEKIEETRPAQPGPVPSVPQQPRVSAPPASGGTNISFAEFIPREKKGISPKVIVPAAAVLVLAGLVFVLVKPKRAAVPVSEALNTVVPAVEQAADQSSGLDRNPEHVTTGTLRSGRNDLPVTKKVDQPQYAVAAKDSAPKEIAPEVPSQAPQLDIKVPPGGQSEEPVTSPLEPAKEDEKTTEAAAAPPPTSTPTPPPAEPAPKAKSGDLVLLEDVDTAPAILSQVNPAYPMAARNFGLEGSVTVNALVSETGDVIRVNYLRGLKSYGFDKAAEAAVLKWKFKPAVKDGVNVRVWKPITLVFKNTK